MNRIRTIWTIVGLSLVIGLSWRALAATTPADASMPGMSMRAGTARAPVMPTPGTPFERVPLAQLPPSTITGPTRMGQLVMPPGMIMTASTSLQAMRYMAAVDPAQVKASAASESSG